MAHIPNDSKLETRMCGRQRRAARSQLAKDVKIAREGRCLRLIFGRPACLSAPLPAAGHRGAVAASHAAHPDPVRSLARASVRSWRRCNAAVCLCGRVEGPPNEWKLTERKASTSAFDFRKCRNAPLQRALLRGGAAPCLSRAHTLCKSSALATQATPHDGTCGTCLVNAAFANADLTLFYDDSTATLPERPPVDGPLDAEGPHAGRMPIPRDRVGRGRAWVASPGPEAVVDVVDASVVVHGRYPLGLRSVSARLTRPDLLQVSAGDGWAGPTSPRMQRSTREVKRRQRQLPVAVGGRLALAPARGVSVSAPTTPRPHRCIGFLPRLAVRDAVGWLQPSQLAWTHVVGSVSDSDSVALTRSR
jgi:hypothetical protein